jgi:hypothetical protein
VRMVSAAVCGRHEARCSYEFERKLWKRWLMCLFQTSDQNRMDKKKIE